jgi:hypothetical protein
MAISDSEDLYQAPFQSVIGGLLHAIFVIGIKS